MLAKSIYILHGPNLNLLGVRQPNIYGYVTLDNINARLAEIAESSAIKLIIKQSNSESELINLIHDMQSENSFLILNPAGFTHTSIALRDSVLAVQIPFIEVHLSNIYSREEFRTKSFFSDIAIGVITGLGVASYELALTYAINYMQQEFK